MKRRVSDNDHQFQGSSRIRSTKKPLAALVPLVANGLKPVPEHLHDLKRFDPVRCTLLFVELESKAAGSNRLQ